mmetsp:Transcript_11166/g.27451  ORF Transcript_11166/g.27451 Transcript_11166/m.27451 type:complete len:221 (+) Transcript_11166:3030-3692(+)
MAMANSSQSLPQNRSGNSCRSTNTNLMKLILNLALAPLSHFSFFMYRNKNSSLALSYTMTAYVSRKRLDDQTASMMPYGSGSLDWRGGAFCRAVCIASSRFAAPSSDAFESQSGIENRASSSSGRFLRLRSVAASSRCIPASSRSSSSTDSIIAPSSSPSPTRKSTVRTKCTGRHIVATPATARKRMFLRRFVFRFISAAEPATIAMHFLILPSFTMISS